MYSPKYYFTPKLEIKPQRSDFFDCDESHYFTPKLEIKPQQGCQAWAGPPHYFTPKLEIKPQHNGFPTPIDSIILHQN